MNKVTEFMQNFAVWVEDLVMLSQPSPCNLGCCTVYIAILEVRVNLVSVLSVLSLWLFVL